MNTQYLYNEPNESVWLPYKIDMQLRIKNTIARALVIGLERQEDIDIYRIIAIKKEIKTNDIMLKLM